MATRDADDDETRRRLLEMVYAAPPANRAEALACVQARLGSLKRRGLDAIRAEDDRIISAEVRAEYIAACRTAATSDIFNEPVWPERPWVSAPKPQRKMWVNPFA